MANQYNKTRQEYQPHPAVQKRIRWSAHPELTIHPETKGIELVDYSKPQRNDQCNEDVVKRVKHAERLFETKQRIALAQVLRLIKVACPPTHQGAAKYRTYPSIEKEAEEITQSIIQPVASHHVIGKSHQHDSIYNVAETDSKKQEKIEYDVRSGVEGEIVGQS